ncbi:expressed unknown protein [Ectocarpus siliculosus]|uniref:BAR domain-containing protein n=1 Tax=Ectocarpus siliculosus TaxID=2880 RepID=D8LBT1_ECTSI|nr:expressed unknown protein [Ectocarpus siliculosus]|eukprot:CBN76790.1 expressed unknown protein [Ectocarpus siliculosus]
MQVYLTSWQAMCRASAAIAKGLAKLAKGSDGAVGARGDNDGVKDKQGVSPLVDMARLYDSAHRAIDRGVREPTQRVVEDTTLRETGALLSRFPPIFAKVTRRKQVLADVEAAKSRVRAAEAAREKERDSFAVVAGKEHRRRMSDALATAVAVAEGVTAEVVADAERLEREREAMLVPQVSALVGGQAFFMRRSAVVLEKLASQLPHSALALCQLLGPRPMENRSAPPPLPRRRSSIQQTLSPSVAPVDVSGHSAGSSSTVVRGFDGGGSGGGGSSSSTMGLVSPHQQAATTTTPALSPPGLQPHGAKFEPVGLSPTGSSASSPPPPPAAVGTPDRSQSCSRPSAMARGDPTSTSKSAEAMNPAAAAAAAAAAAPAAPLLPPRPEISGGRAGGDGKR